MINAKEKHNFGITRILIVKLAIIINIECIAKDCNFICKLFLNKKFKSKIVFIFVISGSKLVRIRIHVVINI